MDSSFREGSGDRLSTIIFAASLLQVNWRYRWGAKSACLGAGGAKVPGGVDPTNRLMPADLLPASALL
jgi:hypothetical protein